MLSLRPLDTFGSVAAEDDAVLDYFLKTDAVGRIQSNKVFVVLGRKGSGKTALVRHFVEGKSQTTSKSLNLRGYPWLLHAERVDHGASVVEAYVSSWRYLIVVELASVVLRHAARNDSAPAKTLRTFFEENYGGMDPALGDVLRPPKLKLKGLAFEPMVLGNKLGSIALDRKDAGLGRELDALTQVLLRTVKDLALSLGLPSLILHFDELDHGLLVMDEARGRMLIGLILAARSIRHDCRDAAVTINPVVYLRTDLWEELQFSDKNKITETLTLSLEWDSATLRDLVDARLRAKLGDQAEWGRIATSDQMRGSQAKWDHILARTFLRPRDLIQYLNAALSEAKRRQDRVILLENEDIVGARERYSAYLKRELDDEIVPHWPRWDDALQACSAIANTTFDRDQFVLEYSKRQAADNSTPPDEALRLLYAFSVLAYERRSGYGGTSWVFRYTNPEAGWDTSAARFKVHPGLQEYAKLREAGGREE
jgi:hypothetical protein